MFAAWTKTTPRADRRPLSDDQQPAVGHSLRGHSATVVGRSSAGAAHQVAVAEAVGVGVAGSWRRLGQNTVCRRPQATSATQIEASEVTFFGTPAEPEVIRVICG